MRARSLLFFAIVKHIYAQLEDLLHILCKFWYSDKRWTHPKCFPLRALKLLHWRHIVSALIHLRCLLSQGNDWRLDYFQNMTWETSRNAGLLKCETEYETCYTEPEIFFHIFWLNITCFRLCLKLEEFSQNVRTSTTHGEEIYACQAIAGWFEHDGKY